MGRVSCWIAVTVGCGMLIMTGRVPGQDWPQWRGPNRDGKVSGFTAPQTWPTALKPSWKATVGLGDSTPALVGDKLYVFARQGEHEVTLCLDAATGKKLWEDRYATPAISGPDARQHAGPRSSPAVGEGKVVTLGVNGVLSCLDASSGKVLWRNEKFTAVPRFHTAVSPMIVEGLVVVQLGSETKGAVVAFELATGAIKWTWDGEGPMYASPVLLTAEGVKQIVTLTSKSVVGLALTDGKLLWRVPFEPKGMAYNAATPIVEGPTVIVTGAGRGTKALRIEKQGDGFVAKEVWSNPGVATAFNTPVLKDGLLFGLSDKGVLFCLDAKTGKTAWTDTTKRDRFGAIVDAGSILVALPGNAELVAFKPDATRFDLVARLKVADTPIYAHPVIAGNRIFIKELDAVTMSALP